MELIPTAPAVLARMRPGKMGLTWSRAWSTACSSASDSLGSPAFRLNQYVWSSLENRLGPVGEPRPELLKGFESTVSRRRADGLVAEDGDVTPYALPVP